MKFQVLENGLPVPQEARNIAFLCTDNWNDYWDFQTQYILIFVDADGEKHVFGSVKIGQFDFPGDKTRPQIPNRFSTLNDRFFSLGQDADYYEDLRNINPQFCNSVLAALNDVAADPDLFESARGERVMGVSLMRSVNERTVTSQYRRIIAGGSRLTEYHVEYTGPTQLDPSVEPEELSFSVEPGSTPPSNIQIIIGRNGVGKSFLVNAMARALVHPEKEIAENGEFQEPNDIFEEGFQSPFANVLSISFSAFDDFPLMHENRNALRGMRYTSVGLQKLSKETNDAGEQEWFQVTQEPNDLAKDFIESAKVCASGEKSERWRRALQTLEADSIFNDAGVTDLFQLDNKSFGRTAGAIFRRLSSGHKIVLLTITKLVEKTEERTLVLMDEPEAHLHPPLLSAFIRAISDLLVNRNGVAIIATHSPVVLQEVPKSCVWKLIRHGGSAKVERPERETFAEDVGVLTHDIFGLEVTRSGFYKMLIDSIDLEDEFDDVIAKFDNEIGYEGRALISSFIATRDQGGN